jgi:peptidoglycan/xylan/chitin deacetylase (PgdA/CDA1 family)
VILQGAPVLMYHGMGASIPANVDSRERRYWLSPESFARHLEQIRATGQRIRALHDVWAPPEHQPRLSPVVLTFDDGRVSDYAVAFPLLLAARAVAEFFVNTSTMGQPGYLTWGQAAEMRRAGMSFQSHAHDHVVLLGLPRHLLANQLRRSKQLLEDRLGARVDFLAAPYGLFDRRVVAAAREVGYRAVCTSLAWPARPLATTINRVAVFRDTTEQRLAAILRRQPSGYVPAAARAALLYLPKRVLLRLDPRRLGAQAPAEIA